MRYSGLYRLVLNQHWIKPLMIYLKTGNKEMRRAALRNIPPRSEEALKQPAAFFCFLLDCDGPVVPFPGMNAAFRGSVGHAFTRCRKRKNIFPERQPGGVLSAKGCAEYPERKRGCFSLNFCLYWIGENRSGNHLF